MNDTVRIEKERKFWDKTARQYDKNTGADGGELYRDLLIWIKEEISEKDIVLEIACGTGIISNEVAKIANKVVGFDISKNMISQAINKLKELKIENTSYFVGDGYRSAFADKTFDVVLCCNVFHLVQNPARVIKEVHRVLKDDGFIITATDLYGGKRTLKGRIRTSLTWIAKKIGFISFVQFYKGSDLLSLIENNGFRVIEKRELNYIGMQGLYTICKKT